MIRKASISCFSRESSFAHRRDLLQKSTPFTSRQRDRKRGIQSVEQNALFEAFGNLLSQQKALPTGSHLKLEEVCYQPAGSDSLLLDKINMELECNKTGLIFGKSGSGKTTLLQVIAGLTRQDSGKVSITRTSSIMVDISAKYRLQEVGMVFQFPERHFLGHTIRTELTFGWPQTTPAFEAQIQRLQKALTVVGLTSFDLDMPTQNLSDGFKRRLALAVQLVRQPSVLLLDEPLAGLDWKARGDMLTTLKRLKQECTIVIVSHDLKELTELVDRAWKMNPGGRLVLVNWPDV